MRRTACLEDLPNELLLIVFTYLSKLHLFQAFLRINGRLNDLLSKYAHHINLSSVFSQLEIEQYCHNVLPQLKDTVYSLTLDSGHIGRSLLETAKCIPLHNLSRIKLIGRGLDLQEDLLRVLRPDVLHLVITSFNETSKLCPLASTSVQRLKIEFETGEDARHFLSTHSTSVPISITIDLRVSLPKLSDYFQLFSNDFQIRVEKLYVSIFSIDTIDHPQAPRLPHLLDLQLETCTIPIDTVALLLPRSDRLQRFAFIGPTSAVAAKSWKNLLARYHCLERFDLHLSQQSSTPFVDLLEWKREFPQFPVEHHSLPHSFRLHASNFEQLERLHINECIDDLQHIEYASGVSHLIMRSQYWSSYFDVAPRVQTQLCQRFNHVRRLSTTVRQLERLLSSNCFERVEQLDLEFAEKYGHLPTELIVPLSNVKSMYFSSMYDGVYDLSLHTLIKSILLEQCPRLFHLSIDAIRIVDETRVHDAIWQWYVSRRSPPYVNYVEGKCLSIWF